MRLPPTNFVTQSDFGKYVDFDILDKTRSKTQRMSPTRKTANNKSAKFKFLQTRMLEKQTDIN